MRNWLFFVILFYEKKADFVNFSVYIDLNEFFSSLNKSATALSLASIMINCGDHKDVLQYLSVALESTDENIKETAIMVQQQFEKQKK